MSGASSSSPENRLLSEEEIQQLLAYWGFGNPAGKYWFVGMEEQGAGSVRELKARLTWKQIEDVHQAHLAFDDGWDSTSTLISTWSTMIRIAQRLNGEPNWADAEAVRAYQGSRFGRLDGELFLTEILPLPARSVGDWPYAWLYGSRDEYCAAILPKRMAALWELFMKHRPPFVFCYGKAYWSVHQELFQEAAPFEELIPGKVMMGTCGSSKVVLTRSFSRYLVDLETIERIAQAIHG